MKISDNYSEDEFIPIMTLLSIVVGYPVLAQNFIEELFKAGNNIQFKEFIKNPKIPDVIRVAITTIVDKDIDSMTVEPFKRNLELISRFSFRTIML